MGPYRACRLFRELSQASVMTWGASGLLSELSAEFFSSFCPFPVVSCLYGPRRCRDSFLARQLAMARSRARRVIKGLD
jgi:hypothetical protein